MAKFVRFGMCNRPGAVVICDEAHFEQFAPDAPYLLTADGVRVELANGSSLTVYMGEELGFVKVIEYSVNEDDGEYDFSCDCDDCYGEKEKRVATWIKRELELKAQRVGSRLRNPINKREAIEEGLRELDEEADEKDLENNIPYDER